MAMVLDAFLSWSGLLLLIYINLEKVVTHRHLSESLDLAFLSLELVICSQPHHSEWDHHLPLETLR